MLEPLIDSADSAAQSQRRLAGAAEPANAQLLLKANRK
jgi:hypothetical protein